MQEELGQLNRKRPRELQMKASYQISKLERKFNAKQKGVEVVHEEVWQGLVVVGVKVESYDKRAE